MPPSAQVSLISRWFVKPDCWDEALTALKAAEAEVRAREPGTLTYRIHVGSPDKLQSLPPVDGFSILFFEVYRDAAAFKKHLKGPTFTTFVREHGRLFVPAADGKPYTSVDFLSLHAGFTRQEDAAVVEAGRG
jgi:uncharacterized protein